MKINRRKVNIFFKLTLIIAMVRLIWFSVQSTDTFVGISADYIVIGGSIIVIALNFIILMLECNYYIE